MPIYEYQCRQCGTLRDVRHGYGEPYAEPCAKCGGEMARRYSPTGIVFKGSGFYVTDSRKASGGSKGDGPAKKDEVASGAGSGTSEASSESSESGAKKDKGAAA